ncbi:MAG: hypothetical protein LBQ70_00130 [Prevotellaceae bacterium]|jgi:hypothetical protein|nr:hypothetical protein [Prevotellaceae bacterium]
MIDNDLIKEDMEVNYVIVSKENQSHSKEPKKFYSVCKRSGHKTNKMKKIISLVILIVVLTTAKAQYSTYYNIDVNQRVDANINKNVNVSGNVYEHKTITTIDYGALQLANAQNEKNRLENLKYADEQQRRIALEIATDPIKAYDYGYQNVFKIKGKDAKPLGFRQFIMSYRVPNNALFVQAGAGRFENVSSEGITTEILIYAPVYNKNKDVIDVEKTAKMEVVIVGQLNDDGDEIFVHKKDIKRATVFGVKGFKYTMIWEDDYQYTITDNFISFDPTKKNGISYFVKVRTYGNKGEVSFEELEGRRYYLRLLIERIISTAYIGDEKY